MARALGDIEVHDAAPVVGQDQEYEQLWPVKSRTPQVMVVSGHRLFPGAQPPLRGIVIPQPTSAIGRISASSHLDSAGPESWPYTPFPPAEAHG